jgi:uncharacterized Zn finger protein
MIATSILAKVDADRLARGVEGLTAGAYIIITRQNEAEISAYVTNGDGKRYSVTLTEGRSFCGCGDSMFRGKTCKHSVVLALYAIRTPQAAVKPEHATTTHATPATAHMIHVMSHEEPTPNLKLARVRRHA